MHYTYLRFAVLLLAAALPALLHGQDPAGPVRSAPYVDVTVEVHGLEASAGLLNEAMAELSNALAEIAASPEDLTPEQLAAFAALAERTNELVVSFERTLQGLGPAIREAQNPSREVLVGLLDTAKAEAIDPTLASIDRRVRSWLILSILGGLLIVGIAGLGLYVSTRQLRAMAGLLRSLGDEYRIVPREALVGAPGAAAAPAPDYSSDADSSDAAPSSSSSSGSNSSSP